VNSRYRIYAAAGLVGVLVLVGGFLMLGHGQASTSSAAPVIKPLHPVANSKRATKSHHAAKVAKKLHHAARATAKAKAKAKVALAPPSLAKTKPTDAMPAALADALARHSVVVVSLIAPGATVDEMAYQEAGAGAKQAGAGFVRIIVANNDDVQALSTLVGASASPGDRLFDAPAVFVFRRPAQLFVRFNGFVDADTVAQAATNAAPGAAG
jgi:hypothetical protein